MNQVSDMFKRLISDKSNGHKSDMPGAKWLVFELGQDIKATHIIIMFIENQLMNISVT